MRKYLLLILAVLLFICPAVAEDTEPEAITSTFPTRFFRYLILEDGTIEIIDYIGRTDGREEAPIVPDELDYLSVTKIGKGAFSGHENMIAVLLPDSVIRIGEEAFMDCTSLPYIRIPESTSEIETRAFANCVALKSITIPDSVTWMGEDVFRGCDSLTVIAGRDSYAEQYCRDNKLNYTYPDEL